MAQVSMDILDGSPPPKRGDLVHTNVGDRRERTWMVLRARQVRRTAAAKAGKQRTDVGTGLRGEKDRPVTAVPRYKVWMARWWELEPEMRMRLFQSAERNGGQRVGQFTPYKAKKRKSFEQYMDRGI